MTQSYDPDEPKSKWLMSREAGSSSSSNLAVVTSSVPLTDFGFIFDSLGSGRALGVLVVEGFSKSGWLAGKNCKGVRVWSSLAGWLFVVF